MSKTGKALIDALKDAKTKGVVNLKISPDVATLRKRLHLSQRQFSIAYQINPETLKKWEQHKRTPDSVSRAYLKCIAQKPALIRQIVNS